MFLPGNDLEDNDPKRMHIYGTRYRPYYKKESDGKYEIVYSDTAIKRDSIGFHPIIGWLRGQSIRLSSVRLYKNLNLIRFFSIKANKKSPPRVSEWFLPKKSQVNASLFFLEEIIKNANSKGINDITLFAIPSKRDIKHFNVYNSDPKSMNWVQNLKSFETKYKSFKFINGFNYIPKDKDSQKRIFLECDNHWSEEGHRWAASIISRFLLAN
tara:strand:+ start:6 stop:641 length:636 start_codon:yes stop_codon:yes gene_type:complete